MDSVRGQLQEYLREHLDPELRVESLAPIAEGHSGFTYWVEVSSQACPRRLVLRLPPPGARLAGPADVIRQGRIMAALHEAGFPAPALPVICVEPVLDGRPFILMEAVPGLRIEAATEQASTHDILTSAIDVLRRLHAVPLRATGIGEETPMPLDGELARWRWLMDRSSPELTEAAPELARLLARDTPPPRAPVLVHGDYHYGNMVFDERGQVLAVLDWEIAQLGQPLLDVGCLCVIAERRRFVGAPNPGGALDVSVDQVVELYGADPGEMNWYLALSCYKYASIFGYNLMLHRRGKRPDPMYEGLTGTVEGLIQEGLSLLAQGG